MALSLPPEVSAGEPVRAQTVNQIIRALRSLTPRDTATIRHEMLSGGTLAHVVAKPQSARAPESTAPIANLILTDVPPPGYPALDAEGAEGPYCWVTWGHVSNIIPSNMTTPIEASDGLKVYLEATTNGLVGSAFRVMSVKIDSGDTVPEDEGGGDESAPTKCYYPIGAVSVQQGGITGIQTRSGGNLSLTLKAIGSMCLGPSEELPTGGSRTTYTIDWKVL